MTDKSLLTPAEVEKEFGWKEKTLANWRWMGIGPDYTKRGRGRGARIHYRRAAIEAYLDQITVSRAGVP